ncbi:MAG: D-2-hydroxyacid dehydrogenase [Clostridiales bacterium]|jgi:glycerate dehydrogenase|nr:D-2-hydroxyacid dehydrogenase [Clostridiales bacterium]OPZ68672.1 MAG: Glycerate dehydrogenase [Firmicutes bacterium ADurb.Bin467]
MRIVILDGNTVNPGDLSWGALGEPGDLTVYDRTPDALIEERIAGAEIAFTNKTPLTRETISNAKSLRFIGVLATGYNTVDVRAARERGIPVANVPAYGTESVAQFAIALLLEICHHVGHHAERVRAGRWAEGPDFCFWETPQIELAGKAMGILGFGRIGRAVGGIARALGMRVLACDRHEADEGRAIAEYVPLDALLREADVLSLHCPLTPETERIIDRAAIGKMKDVAILINNSRGALLNERDVADALNAGKLAAAAVDVVSEEPIRPDNPLLTAKNCLITPHISWVSRESRGRIVEASAGNLRAFLRGEPKNVVN